MASKAKERNEWKSPSQIDFQIKLKLTIQFSRNRCREGVLKTFKGREGLRTEENGTDVLLAVVLAQVVKSLCSDMTLQ